MIPHKHLLFSRKFIQVTETYFTHSCINLRISKVEGNYNGIFLIPLNLQAMRNDPIKISIFYSVSIGKVFFSPAEEEKSTFVKLAVEMRWKKKMWKLDCKYRKVQFRSTWFCIQTFFRRDEGHTRRRFRILIERAGNFARTNSILQNLCLTFTFRNVSDSQSLGTKGYISVNLTVRLAQHDFDFPPFFACSPRLPQDNFLLFLFGNYSKQVFWQQQTFPPTPTLLYQLPWNRKSVKSEFRSGC